MEASVEPAYCDMAAHNLRVREQHRELLRGAGFPFCDDHAQQPDLTLRQAQQTLAEPNTAPLQDLICQGVGNSSCDHDLHQNMSAKLSVLHCLCCSRRQTASGTNGCRQHLIRRRRLLEQYRVRSQARGALDVPACFSPVRCSCCTDCCLQSPIPVGVRQG